MDVASATLQRSAVPSSHLSACFDVLLCFLLNLRFSAALSLPVPLATGSPFETGSPFSIGTMPMDAMLRLCGTIDKHCYRVQISLMQLIGKVAKFRIFVQVSPNHAHRLDREEVMNQLRFGLRLS